MSAFDRPRDSDEDRPIDQPAVQPRTSTYALAQLTALADRLRGDAKYGVELLDDRGELRVWLTTQPGMGEHITCQPRQRDRGQWWFWTLQERPLARASEFDLALTAISKILVVQP